MKRTEKNDNKNKETTFFTEVIKPLIWSIVIVIAITFTMKIFNLVPIRISGESMSPTFHDKYFLIIKGDKKENEEIVVFSPPSSWEQDPSSNKIYIKRIVGTPGDKITINNDSVKVNGETVRKIPKDYSSELTHGEFTVPKDEYFVMGDNTSHSNDSLFEYSLGNKDIFVKKENINVAGSDVISFPYWFRK